MNLLSYFFDCFRTKNSSISNKLLDEKRYLERQLEEFFEDEQLVSEYLIVSEHLIPHREGFYISNSGKQISRYDKMQEIIKEIKMVEVNIQKFNKK